MRKQYYKVVSTVAHNFPVGTIVTPQNESYEYETTLDELFIDTETETEQFLCPDDIEPLTLKELILFEFRDATWCTDAEKEAMADKWVANEEAYVSDDRVSQQLREFLA